MTVTNHQSGELRFDVTTDMLNGANNGWLLSKDKENKGSKVSFYSKEGAAAAGNPDCFEAHPRVRWSKRRRRFLLNGAARCQRHLLSLRAITGNAELPDFKRTLQKNAIAAYTCEVALTSFVSKSPLTKTVVKTAYRSWLNDYLTLAGLINPMSSWLA